MLSSQQTGDRWVKIFLYLCIYVHGLRSPMALHHTHFHSFSAHCPPGKHGIYPLNISLCSLSTHWSSRFDFFLYPHTRACQLIAVAVTFVCRDVFLLLSFFKIYSKTFFCYDTCTKLTSMWPRYLLVFWTCIILFFFKRNFVCLQLSVTRAGKKDKVVTGAEAHESYWGICVQLKQNIILTSQCNIFSTAWLFSSLTLDLKTLIVHVNIVLSLLQL